jgi:asparagine synthase (glutamine-hydrolysing)
MCGILGTIPSVNEIAFEQALNTLFHRGPDGSGIWSSPDQMVTLGHRRLSILDLSDQGKQPMHFGHLSMTFNGEIYNFIELREILTTKGYKFISESDSEIVMASFLEWGEACFEKFNGMWAIAIWDSNNKRLLLSRDRYGKKPLFYSLVGNRLVFASEMKAILPFLPSVEKSDDFKWCKNNPYAYESTDKCLIKGIKRFPAGCFGYYTPGEQELKIKKYWNELDLIGLNTDSYEQQIIRFRDLFEDACKLRMRADVKTGTALSGGLDSSFIASMVSHINKKTSGKASERINQNQEAVIATFPGSKIDESEYARLVVNYLGIKANFIEIENKFSEDKLKDYLYKFEEIYTTPPHPMIETYKAIKSAGITVSIDGHGADELMSGYGDNIYECIFDAGLNPSVWKEIISTKLGLSNQSFGYKNWIDLLKYPAKRSLVKLLHSQLFKNSDWPMPTPPAEYIEKLGFCNSLLYHGFFNTTMPTLLRNFDRMSMAASVEVRMPFMDFRLVNFCFSLPWQSKVRNGYTKAIVRDAAQPFLPGEILRRKLKIGFNAPVSKWMREGWKEYMFDTIESREFKESETINPKRVEQKFMRVLNAKEEDYKSGYFLWKEFSPFLWQKYFLNNSGPRLQNL